MQNSLVPSAGEQGPANILVSSLQNRDNNLFKPLSCVTLCYNSPSKLKLFKDAPLSSELPKALVEGVSSGCSPGTQGKDELSVMNG